MKNFNQLVWNEIKKVPSGKVTTYKAIANKLGTAAYRAVGTSCGKNTDIPIIPCHRVVKSNGFVGGYALGTNAKIKILRKEGVKIINGVVVDFKKIKV